MNKTTIAMRPCDRTAYEQEQAASIASRHGKDSWPGNPYFTRPMNWRRWHAWNQGWNNETQTFAEYNAELKLNDEQHYAALAALGY
jgi:hypothetical protein